MEKISKPNFVIAGAPKSGTTSLYMYLNAHPQVFFSRAETYFFCDDLHFTHPILNEEQFFHLYKDVKKEQSTIGEYSVWNLFSKAAPEKMKRMNPDMRIFILLRNPVEMIYALYNEMKFINQEKATTFEEALSLQSERKKLIGIPPHMHSPAEAFQYFEAGKYFEQVKRYMEIFPKEQLMFILFDDFKKQTELIYDQAISFLNIDKKFRPDFKKHNESKTIRYRWLQKWMTEPPEWTKKAARKILPHESKARIALLNSLWQMNARRQQRIELSGETIQLLKNEFREDVNKLSTLLQRDLTHWTSL
jgi:hypothetical protein